MYQRKVPQRLWTLSGKPPGTPLPSYPVPSVSLLHAKLRPPSCHSLGVFVCKLTGLHNTGGLVNFRGYGHWWNFHHFAMFGVSRGGPAQICRLPPFCTAISGKTTSDTCVKHMCPPFECCVCATLQLVELLRALQLLSVTGWLSCIGIGAPVWCNLCLLCVQGSKGGL